MARYECLACGDIQDPALHEYDKHGNPYDCGGEIVRRGSRWVCSECETTMVFFKCNDCGGMDEYEMTD